LDLDLRGGAFTGVLRSDARDLASLPCAADIPVRQIGSIREEWKARFTALSSPSAKKMQSKQDFAAMDGAASRAPRSSANYSVPYAQS